MSVPTRHEIEQLMKMFALFPEFHCFVSFKLTWNRNIVFICALYLLAEAVCFCIDESEQIKS